MKLVVARIYAAVMGLLDEALHYHRKSRLGGRFFLSDPTTNTAEPST